MKAVQILQKTGYVLMALISGTTLLFGQDDQKTANTRNLIESQRFIFKAETVVPATGRTRHLTPEYYLKVSKDTVIAELPYFGRAWSAPVNITGGGISFTSIQFNYTANLDKKKRWQIAIKPNDVSDIQELALTVFENGKATLNARSNSRQPITFYGYITEK